MSREIPIWQVRPTLEELNRLADGNMLGHLDIRFVQVGDDFLEAVMPVDQRTRQPAGLLHGGASVVLAETLGSVAAHFCIDAENFQAVGLEINANHIRGKHGGFVTGTARAAHLGRSTQIWEVRIVDEEGGLICLARLTVAVLRRTAPGG